MNIDEVKALGQTIRDEVGKAVVGLDDAVELMLVALGRTRVAHADVHGDADAVSAFRIAQQMS